MTPTQDCDRLDSGFLLPITVQIVGSRRAPEQMSVSNTSIIYLVQTGLRHITPVSLLCTHYLSVVFTLLPQFLYCIPTATSISFFSTATSPAVQGGCKFIKGSSFTIVTRECRRLYNPLTNLKHRGYQCTVEVNGSSWCISIAGSGHPIIFYWYKQINL